MWKHSFVTGVPVAGVFFIYQRMPGVWNLTRKTFPYRSLFNTYVASVLLMNIFNTSTSLLFDDYCKRESKIYDVKLRNAKVLRNLIKDTNDEHKKTMQGKANTSLSDDEIMKIK